VGRISTQVRSHNGRPTEAVLLRTQAVTVHNPLQPPPFIHSIHRLSYSIMSSTPDTSTSSSHFQAIFNAALAKYSEQTKMDLLNHPLTSKIKACDSAESTLAIFREQAKRFDKFRNGDHKLFKWLRPSSAVCMLSLRLPVLPLAPVSAS
jgi:hypothetical protein